MKTVLDNTTNTIRNRKAVYKNDICEHNSNRVKTIKKRLIWLSDQGYLLGYRSKRWASA